MVDLPMSVVGLVLRVVLPFFSTGFGDALASVVLDFSPPAQVDQLVVVVKRLADIFEFALENAVVELVFGQFQQQPHLHLQVLRSHLHCLLGEVVGQSVGILAICRYFTST